MNPPKDLGRTKMRKGRKKHLCPSQIFGPLSFPVLGLKARIGFSGILTPALSPKEREHGRPSASSADGSCLPVVAGAIGEIVALGTGTPLPSIWTRSTSSVGPAMNRR